MRYFLNVYPAEFVYTLLRFYTAWAKSGHRPTPHISYSIF